MKITPCMTPAGEATALVCEGFRLWRFVWRLERSEEDGDDWRRLLAKLGLIDAAISHYGSDCLTDVPMYLDHLKWNARHWSEGHNHEIDPENIFIYFDFSLRIVAAATWIKMTWDFHTWDQDQSLEAWKTIIITSDGVDEGYYSTESFISKLQANIFHQSQCTKRRHMSDIGPRT